MNLSEWLKNIEDNCCAQSVGFDVYKELAQQLVLDKLPCKVVTVAGTNGKGSCAAFLESILLAAGLKTAVYSSPHLLCFNERVRINGKDISSDIICIAFDFISNSVKLKRLTYFEFITLASLYIFQQSDLDVVILEVGLGGRFDPVNVVDPDIAVITTIALDHVALLGDNCEKIGFEKSGIMRRNRPIVCGDLNPPQSIYTAAKAVGAKLYCVNQNFYYIRHHEAWEWWFDNVKLSGLPLPVLPLQNAATALMVITLLECSFTNITENDIKIGIARAKLLGRFQILSYMPKIIVDVAHNPESTAFLAKRLQEEKFTGRTLAVVAMLADKDIVESLRPLTVIVDRWYCAQLATLRSAKVEIIDEALKAFGIKACYNYNAAVKAFRAARCDARMSDRIIVFGSFYTVAEILGENTDG